MQMFYRIGRMSTCEIKYIIICFIFMVKGISKYSKNVFYQFKSICTNINIYDQLIWCTTYIKLLLLIMDTKIMNSYYLLSEICFVKLTQIFGEICENTRGSSYKYIEYNYPIRAYNGIFSLYGTIIGQLTDLVNRRTYYSWYFPNLSTALKYNHRESSLFLGTYNHLGELNEGPAVL